ncbi:MAG: UbiA family prenyltransferase [Candidatus Paceibacterota bacterium]|jgi:4-hydroxybenzoate polyprenyltransferase
MEKIRLYAQSVPITFESWILSFAGIVLVRIFFEQFSSFLLGRFPIIEMPTIIHYSVFYLASIVTLMIVLMYFAKTTLKEVSVIALFGLLALWIAPLVDLATGGVGGHIMSYLFASGKELFFQYITYFSSGDINSGVTLGIKIEGMFLAIFGYMYVYTITKNIIKSIGAVIAFYSFMFLLGSLPSLIALFLPQENGVLNSIVSSIISSQVIINNVHPSFSATNLGLIDLAFNKIMLGSNIIIAMFATFSLFFIHTQKKLIAIIKNSRPERIFFFFLLGIFGMYLASTTWSTNWIDIQSYLLTIVAFICAGMFSICQNDIQDEKIDSVSNTTRPLITKDLSKNDMEIASKIFLGFAFLSAYAVGYYTLFFVSFFIFIYYIYSNPPLRLKRFVILNSFLISLACLVVIMAGFFLITPNKTITNFPFSLVLIVIILFSTISNFKDIKDIEGDRADGIKTLPVILGLEKSKKLIAGTNSLLFLIIPWYLHSSFLIVPSIITSLLLWYFITDVNYKEWKVFAIYITYLIFIISTIFLK